MLTIYDLAMSIVSNKKVSTEEEVKNLVTLETSKHDILSMIESASLSNSISNSVELEIEFRKILDFIRDNRQYFDSDDSTEILVRLLKLLESSESKICPELSGRTFKFKEVSRGMSLEEITNLYTKHIEDCYRNSNEYIRSISRGFYLLKVDLVCECLNALEELCRL